MIEAAFDGRFEDVRALINEGADPKFKDQDGNTAFTEACLMGHCEIADYLLHLDTKLDINYANQKMRTALHKAAFNGNH